jgi:hypothetical protein
MGGKGVGLKAVVYLNERTATSGSYWSYFTGWTAEERKVVPIPTLIIMHWVISPLKPVWVAIFTKAAGRMR